MKLFNKIGILLLVNLFAFSLIGLQNVHAKDKCYCMFYNSGCITDNNFDVSTWSCFGWIIFEDIGSPVVGTYLAEWGEDGVWFKWKSNFMFEQLEAPFWFYSGNKKQGFAQDTWGDRIALLGDCYYLKKIKCKDLVMVLGKDMKSLKEEHKNQPLINLDRSKEALKGMKSGYCENIRQDKAFQAERFSFGDLEEETEE